MKNTKHTENLDNSTPQEITSQSKRKILTSIGVSSGILGASALSQQWTKPIVNSIILPAHAQTTDAMMTTMAPGMTTADPMDDMDMTTMAPTDPPAPMPMIMLDAFHAQGFDGGVVKASTPGTVRVTLSVMPTAPVTVTVEGADATPAMLSFDNVSYDKAQEIMITAGDAPANMADEDEAMVTLTAKGGNYDDVKAELTYTVGYYGPDAPLNPKVARTGNGVVKITWEAPKTNEELERYIVTVSPAVSGFNGGVSKDMTEKEVSGLVVGTTYTFMVQADYKDSTVVDPAAVDTVPATIVA